MVMEKSEDRRLIALIEMLVDDSANSYYVKSKVMHAAIIAKIKDAVVRGADVNCTDTEGNTPLHLLCSEIINNNEVIEFLLNNEANVNAQNKQGETSLHNALQTLYYNYKPNRHYDWENNVSAKVVDTLCKHGADPTIKDNNNDSAIDVFKDITKKEETMVYSKAVRNIFYSLKDAKVNAKNQDDYNLGA